MEKLSGVWSPLSKKRVMRTEASKIRVELQVAGSEQKTYEYRNNPKRRINKGTQRLIALREIVNQAEERVGGVERETKGVKINIQQISKLFDVINRELDQLVKLSCKASPEEISKRSEKLTEIKEGTFLKARHDVMRVRGDIEKLDEINEELNNLLDNDCDTRKLNNQFSKLRLSETFNEEFQAISIRKDDLYHPLNECQDELIDMKYELEKQLTLLNQIEIRIEFFASRHHDPMMVREDAPLNSDQDRYGTAKRDVISPRKIWVRRCSFCGKEM